MTTPELAAFLGVPIATLRKWRREGVGPRAFKVGRHLRYRCSDVEAWLELRADPLPNSASPALAGDSATRDGLDGSG